jgi:large subunit ribosomal protein L10
MRPGFDPGLIPADAPGHAEARITVGTVLVSLKRARGPFSYLLRGEQENQMPTDAKRQAVAALVELLRGSSAVAVADYRGLKVSDMQSVRRTLRASGVQLHIAKNRLLKIAADEAQRPELKPMLEGPTALATIDGDSIVMAKALQEALRPYSRVVTLRGALLGDEAIDAGALTRLASLPSREVLLARLAGGMAAPISSMAAVLAGNLRNLAGVLSAIADQKRQSSGSEPA